VLEINSGSFDIKALTFLFKKFIDEICKGKIKIIKEKKTLFKNFRKFEFCYEEKH